MKPGDPNSIRDMFEIIAPSYDFFNDFFSFGLHRLWKRKLLKIADPSIGQKWLDLCCGTGDLTLLLAKFVKDKGEAIGIDSAIKPLKIAKNKASSANNLSVSFYQEDALCTSFPSCYFDGIIVSYGLRNLSDFTKALQEIKRLLKNEGKVVILDFNKTKSGSFSSIFQKLYLRFFVVPFASIIGFGKYYQYLEKSIEEYPTGVVQKQIAVGIGFSKVSYQSICFGQMGILLLKK